MESKLKQLFYDPEKGLSTVDKLYDLVKNDKDYKYTKKFVKDWYDKQEVNQVTQVVPKSNIVYPPITGTIKSYQCDLTFYNQYKHHNHGYKMIFLIINVVSRKLYGYPLKKKNIESITNAFNLFLKQIDYKIDKLSSDNGSEFISKEFKGICNKYGITQVFSEPNDHNQNGKIERANRTIRTKIDKYFKSFKTLNWVSVLPKLIQNYNNSIHSSIKCKPNDVTNEIANKIISDDDQRKQAVIKYIHENFAVGDKVRLLKKKQQFQHGMATYTKSIYTIRAIDKLAILLTDKNGNDMPQRVKPYNVKKINANVVERAPEVETIPKASNKDNKKVNKFENKQRRTKLDTNDEGKIMIKPRHQPTNETRVRNHIYAVGDKVTSLFNVGKEKVWYDGEIIKVNKQTVTVKFSDGEIHNMKREEIKLKE
jgi:hypothetical protein